MSEAVSRCQSCGMRLADGFYGTTAGGGTTLEYCRFCYEEGAFVNPNQTMEEMIESSVQNMTQELKMSEESARKLALTVIPELKRWNVITEEF